MHNAPAFLHALPERPLNIEGAGYYETCAGTSFPPHHHKTWEVVYYSMGQSRCTIAGEVYEGFPGVLLITPPETVHTDYAQTAFSCFFATIDAPVEHPWPRLCFDDPNHTIGVLCKNLVREWGQQRAGREMMLAALVTQLNILLCRTNEQQLFSDAERMVFTVENLLEERFASRITIKEIAREMYISVSTLYAHFALLGHQSPQVYLQHVRLRHALSLLRTSTCTLEVIAHLCGYDSASHLSRHIKRATGKSPGTFRMSTVPPPQSR